MSGADDDVPAPPPGSSESPPEHSPQGKPGESNLGDAFRDDGLIEADPPDGDRARADQVWYVGTTTGEQLGPYDLTALKLQIASGRVQSTDLVWRDGMSDWAPAGSVTELSARPGAAAGGPPPPLPKRGSPAPAARSTPSGIEPGELFQRLDAWLSQPLFFRIVGRASAALGVLLFFGSVVLWYFGFSAFGLAATLLLVFVVAEAAAAIIERLAGPPTAAPTAEPQAENETRPSPAR